MCRRASYAQRSCELRQRELLRRRASYAGKKKQKEILECPSGNKSVTSVDSIQDPARTISFSKGSCIACPESFGGGVVPCSGGSQGVMLPGRKKGTMEENLVYVSDVTPLTQSWSGTKVVAVLYQEDIESLRNTLQPEHTYIVSKARVVQVKEKYKIVDHPFQWIINSKTAILRVNKDAAACSVVPNTFTQLSQLTGLLGSKSVIGISLGSTSTSGAQIDPPIPDTLKLNAWKSKNIAYLRALVELKEYMAKPSAVKVDNSLEVKDVGAAIDSVEGIYDYLKEANDVLGNESYVFVIRKKYFTRQGTDHDQYVITAFLDDDGEILLSDSVHLTDISTSKHRSNVDEHENSAEAGAGSDSQRLIDEGVDAEPDRVLTRLSKRKFIVHDPVEDVRGSSMELIDDLVDGDATFTSDSVKKRSLRLMDEDELDDDIINDVDIRGKSIKSTLVTEDPDAFPRRSSRKGKRRLFYGDESEDDDQPIINSLRRKKN
ncbi:hypothetical protein BUALT_Bualt16G0032400 [Buddleja alternifolia]|uniref:Uncharacterized protein n=1 Tax=Buddleja alternifolia TaxID=168488 RepID=A0AAV6WA81_9LAMI|nr:hypothetical protein BUALT_Bualt16G0032400 [Buddleja alternifolia]